MAEKRRRQSIRMAILMVSLAFFPVIYYYLSPYLIIQGATEGVVSGSFVVFIFMFVSSLVVGRAFCGWACPAGGLQRLCSKANSRNFRGGRRDWTKYFIWAPWIGIIALMLTRAGGVRSIDPLYQTYYGISIQNIESLVLFFIIAGLIALLGLTAGKRAFCHYACWMAPFMIIGRRVRNLVRWPSLRLRADRDRCVDCKTCSKNCPMSLDVNRMVHSASMENTECILCGTCVDNCPQGAIRYSFSPGLE